MELDRLVVFRIAIDSEIARFPDETKTEIRHFNSALIELGAGRYVQVVVLVVVVVNVLLLSHIGTMYHRTQHCCVPKMDATL